MEDYDEPMSVTSVEGSVLVTGPGRLEGAMTADAAEASGRALIEAAVKARQWTNPAPGKLRLI